MAVEVGLVKVGVGVNVLVGGRCVDVDVGVGTEVYVVSVAVIVAVGRVAATTGEMYIPVNKRPVALIPIKSPIDRYWISARITMLLIAINNFRKGFPIR